METVTNPRQYLGHWLKVSSMADVTHCILRYDGLLLVAYCGRLLPLAIASKPILGARHCEVCESLHRQREHDREYADRKEKERRVAHAVTGK